MNKTSCSSTVKLFGHAFQTGNEQFLNELIFERISRDGPQLTLAHYNLHALYLLDRDPKMKEYVHSLNYVWLDGMPIVWILNLFGFKISRSYRITFLDWQTSFFNKANHHEMKVFLLGGTDTNIKTAEKSLAALYRHITFDSHHGYFSHAKADSPANIAVQKAINDFDPHILLVGMGMPIQENWISDNRENINADVIMPLGGYFDYIAGATYTPPRWAGKYGLEWMFRFASNPKKLFRRYFIEPWHIMIIVVRELTKLRS